MAKRKTEDETLSCKKCGKRLKFSIKPSNWKHECSQCGDAYYCGACINEWGRARVKRVCDKCYGEFEKIKITSGNEFTGYEIAQEYTLIVINSTYKSNEAAEQKITERAHEMGANAVTNFKILPRKETTEDPVRSYDKKGSFYMPRRTTHTYYGVQGMAVTLQKKLDPAKKK